MKVYNMGSYGRGTLIVEPGHDHPENSAWLDPKTKAPRQFAVKFENGVAEVDKGLGEYMVDKKLARRSPIVLPAEASA